MLVEFSNGDEKNYIEERVRSLLMNGFIPIIAHVERYKATRNDIGFLTELKDMGAHIQVNADTISGQDGFGAKTFARKVMKHGPVSYTHLYMIERLIKEEYLQALDWKKIPNSKNLLPEVQNKDYDPGNRYSCPYFWGTVGILYNKNVVSQEDLDKEGWNILCDEKYKGDLYMYDSERDSFMIALKRCV